MTRSARSLSSGWVMATGAKEGTPSLRTSKYYHSPESLINSTRELSWVERTTAPLVPIEKYDFRSCPYSKWRFHSEISSMADLVSTPNSTDHNSWSCGRRSGLQLTPTSHAHLETPRLDRDYFNHFYNRSSEAALVVSLWFRPDRVVEVAHKSNQDPILYPLLTWTTSDYNQNNNYIASLGCPGYKLQIALYLGHVLIRYTDQDEAQSCKTLYLRQHSISELSKATSNHLLLTLEPGSTSVHLNGKRLYGDQKNSFNSTHVEWLEGTQLQVFGTRRSQERFRGSIHEINLFDYALSDGQIVQLYQGGIGSFEDERMSQNGTTANANVVPLNFHLRQPSSVVLRQAHDQPVTIDLVELDEAWVTDTILTLAIEFIRLPVYGELTMNMYTNGTVVPIENQSRHFITGARTEFSTQYTLFSNEYFNTPTIDALGRSLLLEDDLAGSESFAYRVVILDDDGFIVAAMSVEEASVQSITVQHVNHRPTLQVPEEAMLASQNQLDSTELVCKGIRVLDSRDHDLDLIRIDVTAKRGWLTLNPQHRNKADFLSCRGRAESSWQCFGNGLADRHMTFVAVPSQAQSVLQDLRYEGFEPGSPDEIVVAIYDGADYRDCLSIEEHEENSKIVGSDASSPFTRTLFDGCYHVNATIKVPTMEQLMQVGDSRGENDDESGILGIPNADFASFDLADLIFWIILTIFMCALCFCCGRAICNSARYFRARGSGVAIDDNSSATQNDTQIHRRTEQSGNETEACSSSDEISNRLIVFVKESTIGECTRRSHGDSTSHGDGVDADSSLPNGSGSSV